MRKRVSAVGLRTRVPAVGRALALCVLVAGLVFVGVSYHRARNNRPFRLRGGRPELSKEVVSRIENYERRMMQGDRLKLLLKADRELVFADGHHELENVYLEVHPEQGDRPDRITAQRTVMTNENSHILFVGAVDIETRDQLKVKTEQVEYDTKTEVGVLPVAVAFERENIRGSAAAATVDAKNKKLELRGDVQITVEPGKEPGGQPRTGARGKPVTIRAAQGNFDQATLRLDFTGGATAEQDRDVMSGETLSGLLNEQKKVRLIEARTNSYLRTMNEGRAAEVSAVNMDFNFDDEQRLVRAVATSNVRGRTLDADSEVALQTAGNAYVDFNAQGDRSVLRQILTDGRPVVTMAAPRSKAGDPAATNKRLTADSVKLIWRAEGRDLQAAEAVGNADLLVEPAHPTPESDRKTLQAPRFDCEFWEAGNLVRVFVATGGSRAVIEPLRPSETRATRTLTSQRMVAVFERETQAVQKVDAFEDARFTERERVLTSQNMTATFAGATRQYEKVTAENNVRFKELDRHAQAAAATYTAADEVLRLRGGEPVVWDSRARMKATEIDSDTRRKISYGRGKTTTTYYNREQTGGAAPFQNVKSPVFIASANAEIRHDEGVGVYTGNARAWQDDNFVRADRIILRRETKRMEADGNVQSALYNARRKEPGGARTVVPVFATSRTMFYDDTERLIHYETDVDIKQGTERITSEVADVYLAKESYETERTVAQRNVVVTQPGKRGTGDWAQYTAADETVELRGVPARVVDAEQGTNEGRRMLVYLREDRVVTDGGGSPQSSGRVRTTHKVKKQ